METFSFEGHDGQADLADSGPPPLEFNIPIVTKPLSVSSASTFRLDFLIGLRMRGGGFSKWKNHRIAFVSILDSDGAEIRKEALGFFDLSKSTPKSNANLRATKSISTEGLPYGEYTMRFWVRWAAVVLLGDFLVVGGGGALWVDDTVVWGEAFTSLNQRLPTSSAERRFTFQLEALEPQE